MSLCINPRCPNPINKDSLLFCVSCGSELLLEGRYRVRQQLGGGGFGKTYEVKDSQAGYESQSDLKVLKVLTYNHPKYVELFQREAQFLARLNHPGIPKVEPDAYFVYYPHNSADPLHCLVMEKIEGLDLKEYINRRGSCISEKRAIQWSIELVSILKEIHSHHFFHRDIKPSNIMLRADGQLVLIDFGTAREVTETYLSKRSEGQVTGLFSAGYSPLEQLNGQAVPESDFFALGRTIVYLLTGKHPSEFYDSYVDDLRWREAAPNVSPMFADFLDRMMARLPSQRPQSAEVILRELEEIYRSLYGSDPHSRMKTSVAIEPLQQKPASPEIETTTVQATRPLPDRAPPKVPERAATDDSRLDLNFISRSQQELAQFIGPIASIICQRILSKNPTISPRDFVEALAHKIPDPKQAEEFQRRVLK
ncbi:protein kinase [Hydrococcus rivularis NIES-593]|uniref:non-specific serine/threonine protein kinase n=1 Tax=Hydrococcus rivularis NIES-593 TaxID=1921803 RepID=A0A1U7H7R8_9CYAN|nr:serine/threonine-protein kinase [Hydrococcus rivularis]OKH18520.1 protein kinase [Hydrococcus rivularis NIES-593]